MGRTDTTTDARFFGHYNKVALLVRLTKNLAQPAEAWIDDNSVWMNSAERLTLKITEPNVHAAQGL